MKTQVGVYSLYPSPDLLMWQKSVMAKHIPNTCGEARVVTGQPQHQHLLHSSSFLNFNMHNIYEMSQLTPEP